MQDIPATLQVRVAYFGRARRQVVRGLRVLVDDQQGGLVGEPMTIPPGGHKVSVQSSLFDSNVIDLHATPGQQVVLRLEGTPVRWLALCMTLAVLVPLAVPLALIYLLVLPLALASGSATSVVVQKVWVPVFRSQ